MLKPNFLALIVIEISASGPVIPMRSIYFIESLPSSSYIISNIPFYYTSNGYK